MKILKLFSLLLSYPHAELQQAIPELLIVAEADSSLLPEEKEALKAFLKKIGQTELMTQEEAYVALFDQSRALSLYLFEHVHGDSRDRGQALVDLKNLYQQHGLATDTVELPDYLPLFLEFLSLLPEQESLPLLGNIFHILIALKKRLQKRQTDYALLFQILARLGEAYKDKAGVISPEAEPASGPAFDKNWEEAPVRFGLPETENGLT